MIVSIEELENKTNRIKTTRRKGEILPALVLCKELREILSSKFPEKYSLRSKIEYEAGFIHNILGNYSDSIYSFQESSLLAGKGGDELRETIGEFRTILTRYLSGEQSAENAFERFLLIYKQYKKMIVPTIDNGLLKSSIFNTHKRICDTAFEVRSDQLELWHNLFFDLNGLYTDELIPKNEIIKYTLLARLHSHKRNCEESIRYFLQYMKLDAPDITSHFHTRVASSLAKLNEEDEERARDYRDLGREISRCGYSESRTMAKHVWLEGLKIDSGRGNKRFLEDIKNELRMASTKN